MQRTSVAMALLAIAGCRSSNQRRHEPSPTSEPPTASGAGATLPRLTPCRIEDRLRTQEGGDDLENVRVRADGNTALVTSERQSTPEYGDSARSGHATWIDWKLPPKQRAPEVMLPYRAYAAAMSTHVGPTHDGLFAYGMAGDASFGLFPQAAAAWSRVEPHSGNPLPTTRTLSINMHVLEPFAVAPERAVAAVAGMETPCASRYGCADQEISWERPFDDSVRVVTLTKPPRSHVVWRGRLKKPRTLVPAIAFGASRGAIAFRANGEVFVAALDSDAKPGKPEKIAEGDVGAPALVFAGDAPIVAWAQRFRSDAPYQIVLFDRKKHEVTTGTASAFAPSLAVSGDQLYVAWMEGDSGSLGSVRFGRVLLQAVKGAVDLSGAQVLSAAGINARDPEVSVSGQNVVVAWSEFPKGAYSRVEVRRLTCQNP